jgi:hypothetical protein
MTKAKPQPKRARGRPKLPPEKKSDRVRVTLSVSRESYAALVSRQTLGTSFGHTVDEGIYALQKKS